MAKYTPPLHIIWKEYCKPKVTFKCMSVTYRLEKNKGCFSRTFCALVRNESGTSLAVDLPENRPENNLPEYRPDVVGSSSSVASPFLPSLMFESRNSVDNLKNVNILEGCILQF